MIKMLPDRVAQKLEQKVIRVKRRSYYLTRMAKYSNVRHTHNPEYQTVVIYQMGKVGSSTVKHSLKDLNLPINLYHVHALTQKRLNWLQKTYRHASKVRGKAVIHDHLVEGIYLRNQLNRNTQQNWKVITLIRDPVARNISTFFQSLNIFFPEWVKEHNNSQEDINDYVKQMIKLFLSKADHQLPLNWFKNFLEPVFGIDVYKQKFPISKGYEIYKNGEVELLLIKLENLDNYASVAFKDFLGIDNFKLKKANITSEKEESQAYSKFKKLIKFPESYLEEMYSSQFVQHFYSQNEIDQLMLKWRK